MTDLRSSALAPLAAQTIALPTETAVAPLIARLAAQLLDLDREIKDLDKQITGTFGQHPDAARITSVNGFGPILTVLTPRSASPGGRLSSSPEASRMSPTSARLDSRCAIPAAMSSVKLSRPYWSSTTDGDMPFSASIRMVATKFLPSPTTQLVRTM